MKLKEFISMSSVLIISTRSRKRDTFSLLTIPIWHRFAKFKEMWKKWTIFWARVEQINGPFCGNVPTPWHTKKDRLNLHIIRDLRWCQIPELFLPTKVVKCEIECKGRQNKKLGEIAEIVEGKNFSGDRKGRNYLLKSRAIVK